MLQEAFGIGRGEAVSLIGAGGKTTTLFRLAQESYQQGGKVLVTTTTKIFKPNKPHVHRLFLAQELEALAEETGKISPPAIIGAGYGLDEADKLLGVPAEWLDRLREATPFDLILIEADGAASRLFKVPSEHEPVVPQSTSVTIWVMAVKILGKPLQSNWFHRAERAASLLGVKLGTALTEDHLLRLIKDPAGCLKGVPAQSKIVALLNQTDSPEEARTARSLGQALLGLGIDRVVITSYLSEDPVKEVIAR